jgi:hypothetical protein
MFKQILAAAVLVAAAVALVGFEAAVAVAAVLAVSFAVTEVCRLVVNSEWYRGRTN